MRLLAYGGTRFAERARVGRWPETLTSASSDFEDTFDIPSGAGLLSYGLGVIDGAAILILRQRQNEQDRGGYPYTLLIDPGADQWRAFGWNAPLLAASLRTNPMLWTDLLEHPERFSSELLLGERISPIAPVALPSGGELPEVGAVLAGSLRADSLYVPAAAIGLRGRPSLDDMARALAALPAFARVGSGWMIGGGRGGRATFGCRAVIDDVSHQAEVDEPARRAIARGRELLEQTRAVKALPSASQVGALLDQPPFEWKGGLDAVLDALAATALAATGATDSESLDAIASFIAKGTPYGREVLASCSIEQESEVVARLISRSSDVDRVLSTVADAAAQPALHGVFEPIATAAVRRTLELQGVLRAWTALRGQSDVWALVGPVVTASARVRARTDARWHVDYLLLGDDPGGAWLAKKHAPAVPEVVAAAINELTAGTHVPEATAWLRAVATTPARDRIALAEKLQIAQHVGDRWQRLTAIDRAVSGGDAAAIAAPPMTPEERRGLAAELSDLLEARGRRTHARPPIDLPTLDRLFDGGLTIDDLRAASERLAPVTGASLEWLGTRGGASLVRDVAVRSWLEGFATPVPLSDIDVEGLRAIVAGAFEGSHTPSDADRDLARRLLEAGAPSNTLTTLIAESLQASARERRRAVALVRLMAPDPRLTETILGWIDPREAATLLQNAAELDRDAVAQAIAAFWNRVAEQQPESAVGAIYALQDFLRRSSAAARAVGDRVGRAFYGPDAMHFPAYVEEARRAIEAGITDDAPSTSDRGFWSRLWKRLGA